MSIVLKGMVGITGLLLAYLGVQWIFTPVAIAGTLGLALDGAPAFNAARGSIGGPLLGNAVLCALGLVTNQGRYLFAAAILIGCVFAGRVIGIVTDGPAQSSVTAVVVEVIMIASLVALGRTQLKAS
jgi:hypothetical protein